MAGLRERGQEGITRHEILQGHFQEGQSGADLRARPLDINILGSWRGECTVKEQEIEKKRETS